jgi:short-subunit dehydrogenase
LMRRQGFGTIVGLSSIAGRTGISGYEMYSASKFALEGLFESLSLELYESNIRMKLVEPSVVNTPFWDKLDPSARTNRGLSAEVVAETIYRAATDDKIKLRYPVGLTKWQGIARKLLPESIYMRLIRRIRRDR